MLANPRPVALALASALSLAACGEGEVPPPPSGGPPPEGFATEILAAHDAVRAGAVVALSPVPDPSLAPFAWSADAAATARAWADGCRYQHNPSLQALGLGENIAATAPPGTYTATQVVGLWASEAPYYDHATNTCDTANPANEAGACGHYTQLVWRATAAVGCHVRTCTESSPFGAGAPSWDYWVCDYAPPGNVVGQRPY